MHSSFVETKLLRNGKTYTLGRKDCDLIVNHKKVSHAHAQIIVGGYTSEDVVRYIRDRSLVFTAFQYFPTHIQANPDVVSSLEVFNTKQKTIQIKRGSEIIMINPSTSHDVQDGDHIEIIVGLPITCGTLS